MDTKDYEKLLSTRTGEEVVIPFDGSLALFALGDIGLVLWRKKRQEVLHQRIAEQQKKK